MDKRPTIYDVAKRSGVSVATVSRVLGKSDYPIRQETRERVLAAAKELRYTPNAMGKSLKTSTSHDLGVILPTITNPSYAMLLKGIQREADRREYNILLCNSHRNAEHEAKNIRVLMEKRVAGILLASIAPDLAAAREAIQSGFPLITMEQALPLPCIHVGYDYEAAGRMMTLYLIEKGHRRIGFIGAPLDRPSRRQMLEGFRHAMQEAGLPAPEEDIVLSNAESEGVNPYEIENGIHAAAYFAARAERPTAYACLNDLTALGAMRGFHEQGIRVPEEASVIGFDNLAYCTLGIAPLTTVDQHATKIGEIAARLLIEQIEQPESVQYAVKLAPELVERQSVRAIVEK